MLIQGEAGSQLASQTIDSSDYTHRSEGGPPESRRKASGVSKLLRLESQQVGNQLCRPARSCAHTPRTHVKAVLRYGESLKQ